jgi:hypothetical protein
MTPDAPHADEAASAEDDAPGAGFAPVPNPDFLVLGDSHAMALKAGCDAQGLAADLLSLSGNIWHSGLISFHPTSGLTLKGRVQKDRLDAARARHAPRGLVRPDLPLILSAGFHIGRLVPPFGTRGHVTDAEGFAADEDGLFVSSGFLRGYVQHHRGQHIYTLKRIARRAPAVIVAPPPVYAGINHKAFIDTIIGLMRAGGLTVYDPRDDFAHLGHTLPADYLAPDGVHGNARYGSEVIGALMSRGLIRRRAG